MTDTTVIVDDPNRNYGDKVVAVEPGGVEFIPLDERHGRPLQMLWTWTSPNMEFATVGVGILGPLFFGLSFWQSVWAIVLGTAVGAGTQGILSSWGPGHGLPQMVISRSAFGFFGNILPAGINALVAGIGWFAVNSVSGALALHALVHALPKGGCLVIVVAAELALAFFGHNLVQAFERYAFPVLAVIFVVASIWVLTKSHPGAKHTASPGGWLLMFGATFGYAAGWNPYATDYTRYLPPESSGRATGFWAALGVFWSCSLLEIAGAGAVTAGQSQIDPSSLTNLLPTWLGKLALVAVVVGAVAANALNVYSGSMSFMALGIRLPTHAARAAVALVFGVVGMIVAFGGLNDASKYENFLLVIAYWIGPWLGVVLVDRWLRRGTDIQALLGDRKYLNWAGPISMALGIVLSIWLFSNQTKYHGVLVNNHPGLGDLTFEVGFLIAAVSYFFLYRATKPAQGTARAT
ncbi:cytosine permease [Jatrophihabitans telluris]|uniref:Cytosine permease n=1 Tax=Jatrophihabitans telluris TaxID=2038343 RepID=A0ABY4QZ93_9ACTN|nr:cytosine permease [Jatrophihabitans telluris]UQX88245.1 cytosine permease [Jatrophihabitans telluris]